MREMNRGHVLQSSPVQQMMAAGNPNWWSINNMRPPSTLQQPSPFLPPTILFPSFTPSSNSSSSSTSSSYSSSSSSSSSSNSSSNSTSSLLSMPSWQNNQDQLQDSWSQLLLGGLVGGEEDKGNMGHFQAKKMANWEEQVLQSGPVVDVKRENVATSCYMYVHANQDHQDFHHQVAAKPSTWSQIMPSANSSIGNNNNSCVTTSCLSNNTTNMLDFSSADKGYGRHPPPDRSSECNSSGSGGAVKKARVQPSCSTQSTFKVRKEKLGDRITALHQLISPFGKTDTASVLLEAIGYIRFLQGQIEALSLPYLGNESQNMRQQQHHQHQHAVNQGERNCIFPEDPGQLLNDNCTQRKVASSQQDSIEEPKKDLRSKGLCLVPLSCTVQVGSESGADFWAPAFGGGFR